MPAATDGGISAAALATIPFVKTHSGTLHSGVAALQAFIIDGGYNALRVERRTLSCPGRAVRSVGRPRREQHTTSFCNAGGKADRQAVAVAR